ncbi:MAG: SDR family oxidoreductase [Candidatus Omnitrophica bacterium]|nr:SDR family oxidoreductase [Candidatus Omnitrophota bacterium]
MPPLKRLMSLSGRKALVTGGAGHIGGVVGEALKELGAAVTLLDLDPKDLQRRARQLNRRAGAGPVHWLAGDLRHEAKTRAAVRSALRTMGGLDILVHCAAYVGTTQVDGWGVPFERQTVEAWDAAIRVNLTSAFVMVQEAKRALSARSKGSVILFASTYGIVGPDMRLYEKTPMANPVGYGASKGGLLQLTRYLATLLAPRVRVNAISPGGVWRNQPRSFHERYVARTPMGRMAREEDLKGAVAYLASDLSSYVTGHNLVVDGGWTAW